MNLPSEAPAVIMNERPPAQWPSTGKVELKNLQVCCCPFFYLPNISSLHNQQFLLN